MTMQQKLDPSSPIVRRVFLLREHMARQDAVTAPPPPEETSRPVEVAQVRKSYQWQMWQKSDLSAYGGDESRHRCE